MGLRGGEGDRHPLAFCRDGHKGGVAGFHELREAAEGHVSLTLGLLGAGLPLVFGAHFFFAFAAVFLALAFATAGESRGSAFFGAGAAFSSFAFFASAAHFDRSTPVAWAEMTRSCVCEVA